MSQSSKTAPKFASFKPKSIRSDTVASRPLETGSKVTNSNHTGINAHKADEQQLSDGRARECSHRRAESPRQKTYSPGAAVYRSSSKWSTYDGYAPQAHDRDFQKGRESNSADLFCIDVRGDRKILQFGSLDRKDVPMYHSAGCGKIIGAPSSIRVNQESSDHQSVTLSDYSRSSRGRPLKLRRDNSSERLHTIRPQMQDHDFAAQIDFIGFAPAVKRKWSPELINGVDYRSIHGKAQERPQPDDDDLEYETESGTTPLSDIEGLRIQRDNAQLFRKCKEQPKDLDVWLVLIRFQAELVSPGTEPSLFTDPEKRTLANIRIAIYDQAMKHFGNSDLGYGRLLAGFLKEGTIIWETSKLMTKWHEALHQCPDDFELWGQYLSLVQSNSSIFQYQQCKAVYAQCLKNLNDAAEKAPSERFPMILNVQLYIFLRFTSFIRDAGYVELAFAMWQIVLEGACSSPAFDFDDLKLECLEKFWDANVPRIGEPDALGWKHFIEMNEKGKRGPHVYVKQHQKQRSPFHSFSHLETESDHNFYLPASHDEDVEECDDPFRVVFFSDMHDVVSILRAKLSSDVLISAFLVFAHLPPLPDYKVQHISQTWRSDSFLPFATPDPGYPDLNHNAIFTLFDTSSTSPYIDNFGREHNSTGLLQHIIRTLEKLLTIHFDNVLAEYLLALKAQNSPSDTRAYAKQLLKARPNDLRLYNAYALIELRFEKFDKARSVWRAALGMCGILNHESHKYDILLSHSWIGAELTAGHEAEALYRLLSVKKVQPVSQSAPSLEILLEAATDRLRAARYFQEGWVQMLDDENYELAVLFGECLAWLTYLTGPYALQSALDKYAEQSSTLLARSASPAAERVHQGKASLLQLHVERKRAHKPSLVRESLSASLDLFPGNDYLLSLYAKHEETIGINDRMRTILQKRNLSPDSASLIQWRYVLRAEMRRYRDSASGSTENSVRATFARALCSVDSLVKHSVELWEMWFSFEQSRLECNRESAVHELKKVFLNGLRFLPWYKNWVVRGLGVMEETGAMNTQELMQVYDVLGERGLRVRFGSLVEESLLETP
nr:protein nrde2 like [Quercus suber]